MIIDKKYSNVCRTCDGKVVTPMFKSEDEKRRERAAKSQHPCNECSGTGTIGIGGRGAATSSNCQKCKGSGQVG